MPYLHAILKQHARQAIDFFLRRCLESRCDLFNHGLQSQDEQRERRLQNLNNLVDQVP